MLKGSELLRASARFMPPAALRRFGRPVVLAFHGVTARIEDRRIEVNHHTVDEFAALAKEIRCSFDALPLAALDDVLKEPERYPRAVFLTCDDGYRNVLTNAADILGDFRIPWTLFVSTRHIATGEANPLFLARLFIYFAREGHYEVPHLAGPVAITGDRSRLADTMLPYLKSLEASQAREAVAALMSTFDESELANLVGRFSSERFLDWERVATLAARGVEVGAHADWHWPMNAQQPPSDIERQARTSRASVTERLGRCDYFAYPFGNAGDLSSSAWQAVRDAGFRHAFTTLSGTLRMGTNPWLLPRYMLMPRERNLPALLTLLRIANPRHAQWQRRLAG